MSTPKIIVIGLSGRFGAGKDYVANACGAYRHSYAEPIYALCRSLVGTDDKSIPGVRRLQQQIGQWMRGHFDSDYPATAERGAFMHWLRQEGILEGLADLGIDAHEINTPKVFANALLRRLDNAAKLLRVHAVTNVRFANEIDSLRAHCASHGYHFVHALVVVNDWELEERREAAGYNSVDDGGVSEEYARFWSDRVLSYSPGTAAPGRIDRPDVFVFNGSVSRTGVDLPPNEWYADAHAFAAHGAGLA